MSETHFIGKVAQKALIEKEGKVLIMRDVRGPDVWELPGGRLNINETPREGLEREVQEELGVSIEVHELFYGEQFIPSVQSGPHLFLMYRATLADSTASFLLQESEVAEVRWITKEDLTAQKIYPQYLRGLEKYFSA